MISADQIPYTQFGEDLKFQEKIYSVMVKAARLVFHQNVQNTFSNRMAVLQFWSNFSEIDLGPTNAL